MSASDPGALDVPLDARGQREVLEQFPAFIAVYEGPELRCVFANAAARAIVGGRDFVGLPLREALPEFEEQGIIALVERVLRDGAPGQAHEWRVQLGRPDSESGNTEAYEVYVNFEAAPWLGADGRQRGVITTGTLVTDIVQARLAARAQTRLAEQRYQRARADVETMQRAFLPMELPVLPRTAVAAHYLVAASEQTAGGDWFDAVVLDERRLALVVGDVVGHGIDASAAMGQLRAVLVELLHAEPDLATVMRRIDDFARRHASAHAATVCVAVLDQHTGVVTWVSAGHLPPLVAAPDGTVRRFAASVSRPLGTPGALPPPVTAQLDVGEVMVLYTDGLIERPGLDLDAGLAELERVVGAAAANRLLAAGASGSAAERVCELTVELLTRTGWSDDVTIVAAYRRPAPPEPLDITVSGLEQLRELRQQVRDWLEACGVDEDDVHDLQLALSETVTNSLEHGYAGARGPVRVTLLLTAAGRVECTVSDEGSWRAPDARDESRGRGLALVQHLAEEVEVRPSATGTTVCLSKIVRHRAVLESGTDGPQVRRSAGEAPFTLAVETLDAARDRPAVAVSVQGPLDATTAARFAAALVTATRGGTLPVSVDLTTVTHLASAGVRELHRHRERVAADGALRIVAPAGSPARQVVDLVGLSPLVTEPRSADVGE